MSQDSRTIVIVGGVAGGASAATRARRACERARIVLFEKDAHVSFANCGLPYYLGGEIESRDRLLVASPQMLERRYRIEVRTGHAVRAVDRARRCVRVRNVATGEEYEQPYDRLILAPGASPVRPSIPGLDARNVFTLRNLADTDRMKAFLDLERPGSAVVVGAGLIGLEMVEQLVRRGLRVTLVELAPQVLPALDTEMAHVLQEILERHGVALRLGTAVSALRTDGDRATHAVLSGGEAVPADLVLFGVGVRANAELAASAGLELGADGGIPVNAHVQTADPHIYAVGDAAHVAHRVTGHSRRVPLAGSANRNGRRAGQHAAVDHAAPAAPVLGTFILRLFDTAAGMTGLSLRTARESHREASAVIVEANHHAAYFPGARPMFLKLVYDRADGRVLGAQAVGTEGIDKRIDVIATAMHFGATVRDLAELDLAYAPPFGSAKDPVHQAAFAAGNECDQAVRFVQPDADLAGLQVVDVRTAAEVAEGMLPGALHIPLDALRERLGELDPARPTVTVCRSGLRAYVAARILRQSGFDDVSDLTGGMRMRIHAEQARDGRPLERVRSGSESGAGNTRPTDEESMPEPSGMTPSRSRATAPRSSRWRADRGPR